MIETATIAVPLHKQSTAEEKLKQFTKRAKKYGFTAPHAEWGDTFFDRFVINEYEAIRIEFIWLTLTFEPIVAPGGWQFAAMIEKTEAGNLISGTLSDRLGHLRTADLCCGHCHTVRNRKKHYVLINESSNDLILGSACVRDYFGLDPAGAIESMHILSWMRDPDDFQDAPPEEFYAAELKHVAALTVAFVRRIGFVSAQDDPMKPRTWGEVNHQLFARRLKEKERVTPTEEEKAIAKQILDRWEVVAKAVEDNLEKANEWDYRKYLFVRNGYVTPQPKQMAVVVGMIAREYKQIGIETERAIAGESQFFGTPKTRSTFELRVTRIQTIESIYGDTEMVCGVLNGTPNRFVWWNSGKAGQISEGIVQVKATVKEHSDSEQYGRQTILNRVALV